MTRLALILPVLLLTLLVENPAFADFQEGKDAYDKGDYETALSEWEPLAEQGSAFAQYNLGVMHKNGQGVPQDYKTAIKWYKLAAEQGNIDAQNNLGEVYKTLQNYTRAHMWSNIVSSQGNEIVNLQGMARRDLIEGGMSRTQLETAQRLARECVKKNYKGC